MNPIDWIILIVYIIVIIYMGFYVGRSQRSQEDYYLGGREMPSWQVALSIVATQVSAISLIGAPAFIAMKPRSCMATVRIRHTPCHDAYHADSSSHIP
jgi:Na+/proline symporter